MVSGPHCSSHAARARGVVVRLGNLAMHLDRDAPCLPTIVTSCAPYTPRVRPVSASSYAPCRRRRSSVSASSLCADPFSFFVFDVTFVVVVCLGSRAFLCTGLTDSPYVFIHVYLVIRRYRADLPSSLPARGFPSTSPPTTQPHMCICSVATVSVSINAHSG